MASRAAVRPAGPAEAASVNGECRGGGLRMADAAPAPAAGRGPDPVGERPRLQPAVRGCGSRDQTVASAATAAAS